MSIMVAKIINGRLISQGLKKTIIEDVMHLQQRFKIAPSITTVLIGHDPASELYLKLRDAACKEVGITSHHLELHNDVSEKEALETIEQLNNDHSVHGILIQYPVPKQISQDILMRSVLPEKDVEGLHPENLGSLLIGNESLVPCTPRAALTILEYEHIGLKGKDVVIINHSNIVGKPLAALLLNRNATVSVCHVYTKNLKHYTSQADIVISGAGVQNLITADHIKKDAIVIDVGIVQTAHGICGDVETESVKEKASLLTPVPGGVGPITIACALANMVKTYQWCMEKN